MIIAEILKKFVDYYIIMESELSLLLSLSLGSLFIIEIGEQHFSSSACLSFLICSPGVLWVNGTIRKEENNIPNVKLETNIALSRWRHTVPP